ncbi:hypothetical protein NKI49_27875 [Mesorhizobium sp. M0587]
MIPGFGACILSVKLFDPPLSQIDWVIRPNQPTGLASYFHIQVHAIWNARTKASHFGAGYELIAPFVTLVFDFEFVLLVRSHKLSSVFRSFSVTSCSSASLLSHDKLKEHTRPTRSFYRKCLSDFAGMYVFGQ